MKEDVKYERVVKWDEKADVALMFFLFTVSTLLFMLVILSDIYNYPTKLIAWIGIATVIYLTADELSSYKKITYRRIK